MKFAEHIHAPKVINPFSCPCVMNNAVFSVDFFSIYDTLFYVSSILYNAKYTVGSGAESGGILYFSWLVSTMSSSLSALMQQLTISVMEKNSLEWICQKSFSQVETLDLFS